jgi:hypothetical protein
LFGLEFMTGGVVVHLRPEEPDTTFDAPGKGRIVVQQESESDKRDGRLESRPNPQAGKPALHAWRGVAQTFLSAGSGDIPVPGFNQRAQTFYQTPHWT